MFSGLSSTFSLLARGRSMLTACLITGTVMMKMMSSTSMTSMNGIMLISASISSLSSWVPMAMVLSSGGQAFFMGRTLPSPPAVTRAPVTK
ncbi:hypothetical protein Y695_04525 [Hydrogenophaga sp. T4]|nr:hypothetical protein Y695_04525 [Hydrogenophaga sp. T4]